MGGGALKGGGDLGALLDGPFGVEFGGDIGAPNQLHPDAGCGQRLLQLSLWFLAGAQDDVVDGDYEGLAVDRHVDASIIDPVIGRAREHFDTAMLERGAVNPASGPPESGANLARLALQQNDFARRHFR